MLPRRRLEETPRARGIYLSGSEKLHYHLHEGRRAPSLFFLEKCMSITVKKFLCTGLAVGVGAHASVGFVEASENFYSCYKAFVSNVSPCVPVQHGPKADPHVGEFGSTSTASLVWAFPAFPAAAVVEQALPFGGQVEIRPSGEPVMFTWLRN